MGQNGDSDDCIRFGYLWRLDGGEVAKLQGLSRVTVLLMLVSPRNCSGYHKNCNSVNLLSRALISYSCKPGILGRKWRPQVKGACRAP